MQTLEDLIKEEEQLILPLFNETIARELGEVAVNLALARHLAIAVRVEREGQILYQVSLPGTGPDNDLWLSGKARVVHHFLHSSFYISRKLIESNSTMEDKYSMDSSLYRAKGGAVPLFIRNGGLAGVLIISGLPDYEDHKLSIETVRNFLAEGRTSQKGN